MRLLHPRQREAIMANSPETAFPMDGDGPLALPAAAFPQSARQSVPGGAN